MSFECSLLYERDFDINDWVNEYNRLYQEFKNIYVNGNLSFKEIPVRFKRKPVVNGRHNSFYHITTGHDEPVNSDEERYPDTKRIEKFYYPKILINNYDCSIGCEGCSGIKVWFEKDGNVTKAFIYFDEKKYVVILEYRKNEVGEEYFLFKTAYYVYTRRQREKFLEKYNKNKNNTLK